VVQYQIHGMHCQACVGKITTVLRSFVADIEVTLSPPRATVAGGKAHDREALNQAVSTVGDYRLSSSHSNQDSVDHGIAVKMTDNGIKSWLKTYYPLFLIVGLISVVSVRGAADIHDWMIHFMAGFFIVFGFFKLLDIRGFRDAYAGYDLLAKKWNAYGLIYPFLELALGFAFLFRFEMKAALYATIIVMGFGSIGVIRAVTRKQAIRCACLGTVLNLPMSTITIIENLGMVLMSIAMLAAL
jgi:copper chaperone CopZ